uniref:hypothetical protein n=1 Tax=Streptomyces sp. NBC_00998 TaxID=2903712 RepID=UPI002F919107|nr:hypothetical protein OG513_39170 [Streptomyces sp. NBC_00998]
MLTWSRQKKLAGCHLKRTHLEDLHDKATAGYAVPIVTSWEGAGWVGEAPSKGDNYRVKAGSLAELEVEVGNKTLAALRLTVCLTSAPNEPRVEVAMGDLDNPQGIVWASFIGFLWVNDSRWFTRLRVSDPDIAAARDRADELEKVLKRSQGVRRLAGGWPRLIHVAAQTLLLWFFINYVGLDQEGDRYFFGGIFLGVATLSGWQAFADSLARTRVRVAPTPVLWWQNLTTNPGLSGAIGALVGILGLIVALISVAVTIMVA